MIQQESANDWALGIYRSRFERFRQFWRWRLQSGFPVESKRVLRNRAAIDSARRRFLKDAVVAPCALDPGNDASLRLTECSDALSDKQNRSNDDVARPSHCCSLMT